MSVFVSPPGLRGRDPFSKLLLTGDALADVSIYTRAVTNTNVSVITATGTGLPVGITKSLSFNGAARLTMANDAALQLLSDASTDMTVDMWVLGTGPICSHFNGLIGWYLSFSDNSNGFLLNYGSSGASVFASAYNPSHTTWHHLAIVRRGSTVTLYVDGVARASTVIGAITLPDYTFTVGAYYWSGTWSYFAGQIANLRVTKGLARWTRDFTPPTRPY